MVGRRSSEVREGNGEGIKVRRLPRPRLSGRAIRSAVHFNGRESWFLFVQDNTEEGLVDLKSAIVVLNEAEFPEFVHEKVDSGARCANHFR